MMKILILLSLVISGCSIIGPGEKGIHTSFGNPSSEVGSGLTLWIPFIHGIQKFDLRVQKHVIETTAASKDLQPITAHIAVNWRIDPSNVMQFFKDVGTEDDAEVKLLQPIVNEVFKAATAKMTAENIVGRRIDLKNEIDVEIGNRLKRYGLKVDDVSIMDVNFSTQFIHAVEAKQISEQEMEQAHYIAEKAKKDADAEVNRARGQAEAQKLLQSSLTPAMLQKLYLEKWNGILPQVQMGNAPLMLHLDNKSAED